MTAVFNIDAPAKINLGLEILGKREDGYHEIRSILAMVDLCDSLEFRHDKSSIGRVRILPDSPEIDPANNLITTAVMKFNYATGTDIVPDITVRKRIPIAAGLGGASSDCAATLLAMNALNDFPLSISRLSDLAATIGSDIPFFLGSPAAVVSGRGVDIEAVPAPSGYVLVVAPNIPVPGKTKTLYASLDASDFTNGSSVLRQVRSLQTTGMIDRSLLQNAFANASMKISPEILGILSIMRDAGIDSQWLSGAGPSHFALFDDATACALVAHTLRERLGELAQVFSVPFSSHGVIA